MINAVECYRTAVQKDADYFQSLHQQIIHIAVTIFLVAVLICAFMQPLFRDRLLDWLRNIL
jgi:hypothetical protein